MSQPPTRLSTIADRYRIERELGSGAMAIVYLAHDLKHDRPVAVKVLKPELAEWLGVDRFLAEIRTTARLRHPHILPLFDSGEADGALYYVMPLVEGTSLRDRLDRDGALALADALRITREIADALAYSHARDIVHRDIKPENILLEGGHALVVDFGIARVVRELEDPRRTQSGHAMGTPLYMSPEQAAGDSVLDGRSDLYSLASVLFEMLTGRPPFIGATAEAILAQRFTKSPPRVRGLRADVPAHVDAAIHLALSRVASDRPASVQRFTELLDAPSAPSVRGDHSIAVLPFENVGASPENEYFSDGITEDIINALARLEGLRVAARRSAFSFKGKNDDLRSIGEKLNVAMVLEGSVRRASDRLRITAQLISVADGYQIWSERFDRDMTDVFAVQEEIANAIAVRLQVTFSASKSERPALPTSAHVEAYELYLKARALLAKRGRGTPAALQYLEQAVALDPASAEAYAALGEAYRQAAWFGYARPADAIPAAKAALGRALELDPDRGDAMGTLALITLSSDRDAPLAFDLWERALSRNPGLSEVRMFYAGYGLCIVRGDDDRAMAEADRGVADDPLNPVCANLRAVTLAVTGHHDEAVAEILRAIDLDGDAYITRICEHYVYLFARDFEKARTAVVMAMQVSGRGSQALAAMSTLHMARGDARLALAAHQEILARAQTEIVDPVWLSFSALGLGAVDEAIEYALQAVEENSPQQLWLIRRPGTEALHAHARYPELRRKMGL